MKKLNKTVALVLVALMIFAVCVAVVGCAPKTIDTEDHLEIKVYKAGNGTDSIKNVAKRFMELNPGKTVEIKESTDPRIIESELSNGPRYNTTDLYLAGGSFFNISNRDSITIDGVTYENAFVSLDGVYESTPYGETVLIKDKMQKDYVNYYYTEELAAGKHSYYAPWVSGWRGIVYNSKMFETYGWTVPVTTDEMFELCDQINATVAKSTNKNSLGKDIVISPFTYSRADGYWEAVETEWWIQYEGMENYVLFGQGMNADGEYTPEIVTAKGILESMKVMEKILGTYYKDEDGNTVPRTNIYCDNTLTFRTYTDIQSTFLYGEEARINASGATTAAMMPVGDWLENEMISNFSEEIAEGKVAFKAMKTPVISALADKTSFKDATDKDAKLRELVHYIDDLDEGKNVTKPSFATDEDVEIVSAARHIVSSQFAEVMIIPTYSSSVELAKEFIRFLYCDEACKIFAQATNGVELPIECDFEGVTISAFQQSKFEIVNREKTTFVMGVSKYPMAYTGALTAFSNSDAYGSMEGKFGVSNPNDFMSAQEIIAANFKSVSRNWNQKLKDAGLLD